MVVAKPKHHIFTSSASFWHYQDLPSELDADATKSEEILEW